MVIDTQESVDIFEYAPGICVILDKLGVIRRCNLNFRAALQLENPDAVGKELKNWVVPEEQNALMRYIEELDSTPKSRVFDFRAQNGKRVLLSCIGNSVKEQRVLMARDITEDAQRAAQVDRARLLSIFKQAPAPINVIKGDDLVIEFTNEAYRKMFGNERELEGKRVEDAFPDVNQELIGLVRRVIKTGQREFGTEYPVDIDWTGNGTRELRYFNFVFEPIQNSEGVVDAMMSFGFDVTDQVLARQTLEKNQELLEQKVKERTIALSASNQELEAFCYSVSHDLRSPLRGIAGFSNALAEDYPGVLDERGKQYLQFIGEGIGRMGQLIDDLLSLSRLSRGELKVEKVNLSRICEELIAEQRQIDPEREVRVSIAPELVGEGDSGLLRILLQNLIANAWKFTRKVSVGQIEIGSLAKDGKTVYFVRDNGAGFNMAYSAKLFGAFQRLHSPGEGFAGTGIGLATVRRVAHRHGGTVWGEGQEGKGATFFFTLS